MRPNSFLTIAIPFLLLKQPVVLLQERRVHLTYFLVLLIIFSALFQLAPVKANEANSCNANVRIIIEAAKRIITENNDLLLIKHLFSRINGVVDCKSHEQLMDAIVYIRELKEIKPINNITILHFEFENVMFAFSFMDKQPDVVSLSYVKWAVRTK